MKRRESQRPKTSKDGPLPKQRAPYRIWQKPSPSKYPVGSVDWWIEKEEGWLDELIDSQASEAGLT